MSVLFRAVRGPARVAVGACVLLALLASPASAQLEPPVDGVVVDSFRPPDHIGAPGNRGWEYATDPGTPVRAVAGGVVAFAGQVGGRLHVSIDHAGGLRTSYSFLAEVTVSRGQAVRAGHQVGRAGSRFHFGVRRNGDYIDPATLFGPGPAGPARLVPRPGRVPSTRPPDPVLLRGGPR